MRKLGLVLILSLLASNAFAGDGTLLRARGKPIPGRYIVQFSPGYDVRATVTELALGHAARMLHRYEHALRGAAFEMNEHQAKAMARHPKVLLVEEDAEISIGGTQTNPPSWGLDRVDQRNLPLNSSYTWDFDGTGVNVYVIDTGIRFTHTEFGGRAFPGADFIGDGQNGNDCWGHGTHVAGTIGGSTFGVTRNVRLYSVRVFGCSGSSPTSVVIAGIDWVTANRILPAVANASLSGGISVSLDTAVNNSVNSGVFYAVAAGNDFGLDACLVSPARAANAYTVAASTQADTRPTFSNIGPCVEVFAPGDSITSAWHLSDTATNTISGTSMATPHVAGAAAILLDGNPSLAPAQVASTLTNRATVGVLTGIGPGSPNRLLYTRLTPPTARFTFTCSLLSCSFDASSSTDDTGIVSYSWDFGDSTFGSGVTPSHNYAATGPYTVTLTVTDIDGQQSSTSKKISVTDETPVAAESFFTVPPCRIADTRTTTPLTAGVQRLFQVTGLCGIPASAKAVSFNVTVVSPTGPGHLVFFPGNQTSGPFAHATINFDPANSPRANNATLRLATNLAGSVNVHPFVAASPGQVHVILDVYGYLSEDALPAPGAQGPFGFQTLTPCRIADTRTGTPIAVNVSRNFTVQGVCGVPAGAAATPLNLTIIGPTAGGHATHHQAGALPPVPTINFNAGVVLTNGARIRLASATPDVAVTYLSPIGGASTHATLDVYGYFKSDAPLKYRPITACRAVDTRFADQGGPTALGAPETRNFQIRGNCGVPLTAKAAAVNITTVGAAGGGYLVAYPSGSALPLASYLTFDPGQGALGNGGIVALSTLPKDLTVTTANSTHVIIDVFGYFQ
ncbi:MAG TPA: S8 family serine peptidase [Thermoanaerobaculia bacterium]|nr:S8 family serine peptidase [Thermoanaerobaculia bacterium]